MGIRFYRVVGLGLVLLAASGAHAAKGGEGGGTPAVCANELLPAEGTVDVAQILGDVHDLRELISSDPAKNLAYQHPAIVMNAAQRTASWVLSKGEKKGLTSGYVQSEIPVYPAFSEGGGMNRIVGAYPAIKVVVDYAHASARGDGAASKMVTLVGPPGTGKTAILTKLAMITQELTSSNPDYFVYTYEWHGLSEYPELYSYANMQPTADGGEHEHPYQAEMNDSPFSLLPNAYHDVVLQMASDRAAKLAGVAPTPVRTLNPKNKFIRDALLAAEMKKRGVTSLTAREQLDVIANHVRLKRLVIGPDGTMSKINAEGKDIDWSGLFMAPNALMINTVGPGHPFSYFLNGKVLRANGSFVILDEYLRNELPLRDAFLEVIENKQVTRGGAPVVNFDAFIVGASNSESLSEVRKNQASRAQVDRLRIVQVPYSLNPFEVLETMLQMKNANNIYMQKLTPVQPSELQSGFNGPEHGLEDGTTTKEEPAEVAEAPVEKADLYKLFPEAARGEAPVGPDGRYSLWINAGNDKAGKPIMVHMAPHTLLFMAQTVVGTRLSTDGVAAEKINPNYSVIRTSAFRNVADRLMILMRRHHHVSPGHLAELEELSKYLREGHYGISARDLANAWLQEAIAEAARPENGRCLTAKIARDVFLRMLPEDAIQFKDEKTRLAWIAIQDEMAKSFLVPSIMQDIHTAVSSGVGTIRSHYEEIFEEMLAKSRDPKATEYFTDASERRPINEERYQQVKQLYRESQGRDFDEREVLVFHARKRSQTDEMHKGLEEAVTLWLSTRTTDLVSYDDLERMDRTGEGQTEVRAKHSDVSSVMRHRLGYCPHCLRNSISLAKDEAAKKKAAAIEAAKKQAQQQ